MGGMIAAGMFVALSAAPSWGAEDADVRPAAEPVQAMAPAPGVPGPGLQPLPAAMPSAPFAGLPALPDLAGIAGQEAPDLSTAVPPPLPSLGELAVGEQTTSTATTPAAPIEIYEFLYVKHDEYGPTRIKLTPKEAEEIKAKETALLMREFPATAGGQQQGQQDASRAFAEWDFYCQQLQLYAEYVKEVVLPEKKDELEDPDFSISSLEDAVQKRTDLKTSYEKKAQEFANDLRDENIEFYERIQQREDRRKRYYEWLDSQKKELDEWARIWARKANATRWVTANGEVRRDDWYYGVNFNPGESVRTTIGGQKFVFSTEPVARVADDELNVLSTNLTPYDILDANGVLKNPQTERQRGTLVEPPILPSSAVPGIIQATE